MKEQTKQYIDRCKEECVPFVPTSPEKIYKAFSKINLESDDVYLELGCGTADNIIIAVNDFNVGYAIGYEINYERYKQALQKTSHMHNVEIKNKSFIYASKDIKRCNVIFCYLLTNVNYMIEELLYPEIKPNTLILSHSFTFKKFKLLGVVDSINIYVRV